MAKKNIEPKVKVGDRFGKLTVIEKVDIPVIAKGKEKTSDTTTNKTKVGWFCKCDCGGEITLSQKTLLKERKALRSCDKCPPEKNPNYVSDKMTFEESQEWDELYKYVKINILGYDKMQTLPPNIVTRLQGLLHGKYMVNNKTVNKANYSYKTVLNTFKFCSQDIKKALKRMQSFIDKNCK